MLETNNYSFQILHFIQSSAGADVLPVYFQLLVVCLQQKNQSFLNPLFATSLEE